jgi:hypothetical protein
LQLCRNELIRLDDELLKSLQMHTDPEAAMSSSDASQAVAIDKTTKCERSSFLLDFSLQNAIPWRAQEYELVNGEVPVVFNVRHMFFSSILVSSFVVYGWRALRSNSN